MKATRQGAGTFGSPMRNAVRLIGLAAVFLSTSFFPPKLDGSDQPAGQGLERWAVLPSRTLLKPELADLVIMELLKIEGVDLVERDQLERISDEQVIQLAAASGVGSRRSIGAMLKADALLLLSAGVEGEENVLNVIVSDCNLGARLLVEKLPYQPDTVEGTAKVVASFVSTLRQRHSEGIKWLAVVPHLVSRDLSQEFDYLQTTYTHLLQSGLSSISGVAVVETEEAPSIARELDMTGAELGPRVVPLEIDVSYETSRSEGGPPRVVFQVRIQNGQNMVRQFASSPMDLETAGSYLAGTLRDEIVQAAKIESTSFLSAEQQFSVLVERADLFAAVGSWDHATDMREAALLLNPQAANQRQRLVREYTQMIGRCRGRMTGIHFNVPTEAMVRQYSDRWGRNLSHIEHLVRNRQVSLRDAGRLTGEYLARINKGRLGSWDHRPEVLQFLRSVFPAGKDLVNEGEGSDPDLVQRWHREAWCSIPESAALTWAFDSSPGNDFGGHFAFCLEVLEQWLPEDTAPSSYLCFRLTDRAPLNGEFGTAYVEFLRELAKSKRPLNVIYGRFGLLVQDYGNSGRATKEHLAVLDELLTMYEELPFRRKGHRLNEILYSSLSGWRKRMERQLEPQPRKSPAALRSPSKPRPETPVGRLRLEPLQLEVKRLDGTRTPYSGDKWRSRSGLGPLTGWTACGHGLDLVWNRGVILWMRQPGLLEEVLVDAEPTFDDIRWDGRHIWIATQHTGVWIVAPSGEVVARITEDQGLPPADRRLLLHVLPDGRVVAVGAFGERNRVWCAVLTYRGDQTGVHVFHRAVHVKPTDQWDRKAREEFRLDPQSVFEPAWMHLYHPQGERQAPRLLVSRELLPPLLIEPQTLEVTVCPADAWPRPGFPGTGGSTESYYSRDGTLLVAGSDRASLYKWNSDSHRFMPVGDARGAHMHGTPRGVILPYGGWLYYFGRSHWSRFNPATFGEERLTSGQFPLGWGFRRYAVSSHYGLVTLGGHGATAKTIFRIEVPEDMTP